MPGKRKRKAASKPRKVGRFTMGVRKRATALGMNEITTPRQSGRYRGASVGRDSNGFFLMTHRARSKSYPALSKIPDKTVTFIRSTG